MLKFDIHVVSSTRSTMDDVRDAVLGGNAQEGYVLHSLEQNGGRGRRGNSWVSPKGNLYMSVLLEPRKSFSDFGQMAFVAALAIYKALSALSTVGSDDIQIKWPNDILVAGQKISGLLLEAEQEKGEDPYLVLGVGMNVFAAPDGCAQVKELMQLKENDNQFSVIECIRDEFLKHLNDVYTQWHSEGFSEIRKMWIEHAAYLNQTIKVRLAKETFEGVFRGIDEKGALLIEENSGITRCVTSGEVHF